jgi:prepilin peptidase CpaA
MLCSLADEQTLARGICCAIRANPPKIQNKKSRQKYQMDIYSLIALIGLLGIAAVIDLKTNKIPNWLTFSAILFFFSNRFAVGGLNGIQLGLYGTFLGIGLLLFPYLLGWMGAGDVKLLGAVGCAVGVNGVILAFLFSAIFGGLLALITLKNYRSKLYLKTFLKDEYNSMLSFFLTKTYSPYAQRQQLPAIKIPYGVSIACGTGLSMGLKLLGLEILSI